MAEVEVGDAVFGYGLATCAEYALLWSWAKMPQSLSFEEAAGYPAAVETAIRILTQIGVQSGETLLVSGATGGVGSAVVQFARQRGINVIGTASEQNHDYLRKFGAVPITYGSNLVQRVRSLAPEGIDAALDVAGSGVIPELIELTGEPAKVLSIADFSAPSHGALVSDTFSNAAEAFAEAVRLFTEGQFFMPVAKIFPLAQTSEAQIENAAGHTVGKLIVTVP